MGHVVPFRLPAKPIEVPASDAIDLLSAVDFALRDIADIARHLTHDSAREQAEACRQMLQEAFDAAVRA